MTTANKKKQQETTKSKHTHHRRKPRKELTGRHDDLTHGFVLNNIHDITRFQNQELSKGTGNEMLVRSHGSIRETKVTMIQDRVSRNERIDHVLKKQGFGIRIHKTRTYKKTKHLNGRVVQTSLLCLSTVDLDGRKIRNSKFSNWRENRKGYVKKPRRVRKYVWVNGSKHL